MTNYLAVTPDLAEFVQALSACRVRYLVVGGHAVGVHSKPRATKDLDVWIEGGKENRERIAEALARFGAPQQIAERIMSARPNEIVWFGRPPNRVDFIQTLPGVDFEESEERAFFVQSGSYTIPVISAEDLVRNKEAVGRPQDRIDVEQLRKHFSSQ